MAAYYLDTSAVLKRHRTEKGTDVVETIYSSGESLLTSHFTCLEFEAVAGRARKGGVLTEHAYRTMLGSFARDLTAYYRLIAVSGPLINESVHVARRYALRAPDALQLASAERARQQSADLVFVASDKELVAAARSLMPTINPEDDDALEMLRRVLE